MFEKLRSRLAEIRERLPEDLRLKITGS